MKHTFNLLAILLFLSMTGYSQDAPAPADDPAPPQGKERVEAMKIGFLTDRLKLTPDEAKAFWPVYNQYEDDLEKLRKSRRDNIAAARKNLDEMSDKDVEKLVDSELAFRQSELDLQKKYHSMFKQVLPIKKVARLYRAEEDFKRVLLEKMKERRATNQSQDRRRRPVR